MHFNVPSLRATVPTSQYLHPASSLAAPVTFPYRPAAQGSHDADPSRLYDPALHSWHSSPLIEYLPAEQSSQAPVVALFISPATHDRSSTTQYDAPVPSLVTPVVVQPSGQGLHSLIDVMIGFEYESLPHLAQVEAPLCLAYVPAAQPMQAETLVEVLLELYLPASHSTHTACPSLSWYLPFSQSLHDACCHSSWYLPRGHNSYFSISVPAQLLPGGHLAHSIWPFDDEYRPTAQAMHALDSLIAPKALPYLPAVHFVHVCVWGFSAYVPSTQSSHSPCESGSVEDEPASHGTHEK